MAKKLSLDDQIKKFQTESWELAEKCSTEHMKLKDQIFEQGLTMEETKCLKNIYKDDSDENKKDYVNLLLEMKI